MKQWLHALEMCQDKFCAVSLPRRNQDAEAKNRMTVFLPVVGLEIGLIWWAVEQLCMRWEVPQPIWAFIRCAIPFLMSGYIHLDGYMNVTDALHSRRNPEQVRLILKDPHIGSYAAISTALLLIAQYAAAVSLYPSQEIRVLILIPIVSRSCSAIAVLLAAKPRQPRSYLLFPVLMLAAALFFGFYIRTRFGLTLIGCIVGYLLALLRACRSLKDMNGDIAGYALTVSELSALTVLAMIF